MRRANDLCAGCPSLAVALWLLIPALQVKPGVYSEDAFRALDYVVSEAGKAGLKVVLSLVDNWKYAGGVDEVRPALCRGCWTWILLPGALVHLVGWGAGPAT